MFTQSDLKQIEEHPLDLKDVKYQIDKFKTGFPPTQLALAATPAKGIMELDNSQVKDLVSYYENNLGKIDIVKFVPASGAATRMFKTLFGFLNDYTGSDADYEKMKSEFFDWKIFSLAFWFVF